MNRTRRLVGGVGLGLTLGAALLASAALGGGGALAQEQQQEGTQSMRLELTPSRGSGVSGSATLTELEGGVRVELKVRGLPEAGIEHINHFHAGGTCADDRAGDPAPATIPLETIVAEDDGTGSGTTTLEDITLSELFDPEKKRYIALHARTEEGQGVPPVISCADVVEAAGSGAVSTKLPSSGGMNPVPFFSGVGILVLGTVAGWLLLRQRIT